MTDFLVRRDDLRQTRVAEFEGEAPELEQGQALLRVDRFGLTANNITYAVFGDAMSYWSFFPAEDGWGRVPMWGFADVERSSADGVEEGARVYGYLPPSSHLVVEPKSAAADGFIDGSAHRVELPSAYQRYLVSDGDPFYREDTEDLQMLLRPLFFTSFLLDDLLDDDGLVERGPVIVSSASSKTAIAAAFLVAQRPGAELIGLTSPGNREFVEGLEVYGSVATYDEIGSLAREPATFVDTAGDAKVRQAVHAHFGDELVRSIAVGVTHWEEFGGLEGAELQGPAPQFFFAPDRVTKRSEDWGVAALSDRVAAAWHPFCDWAGGWLETIPGEGFDAVEAAYLEVIEGNVAPSRAHVLSVGSA